MIWPTWVLYIWNKDKSQANRGNENKLRKYEYSIVERLRMLGHIKLIALFHKKAAYCIAEWSPSLLMDLSGQNQAETSHTNSNRPSTVSSYKLKIDCCSLTVVSDSLWSHGWSMPGFLSFTVSWSLLQFMSIESVLLSNRIILCCPLFLLPSIFSSIRTFSNQGLFLGCSHHVARVLEF